MYKMASRNSRYILQGGAEVPNFLGTGLKRAKF